MRSRTTTALMILTALLALLLAADSVGADVGAQGGEGKGLALVPLPTLLNYQGRLLDPTGDLVPAGVYTTSAGTRLAGMPAGSPTRAPNLTTHPERFTSTIATDSTYIENEKIRITFEESAGTVTGYAISVFNGTGWYQVGVVRPLARFGYRSDGGQDVFADIFPHSLQVRQEPNGTWVAELSARITDQDGVRWQFDFSFRLAPANRYVQVSYSASADGARQLLLFSGPTIYAGQAAFGAAKDVSLFAGLDYNEQDEESMAVSYTPHPLKVTVPLMVVSQDGYLVGLMWDPLQRWDGENIMLQPRYASPNWVERQEDHLLGLLVPTAPRWLDESPAIDERDAEAKAAIDLSRLGHAVRPYPLPAGRQLQIESYIIADYPAEVPQAVQIYVEKFGVPELPPLSLTYDEALRAGMEAHLRTTWDPEQRAWYQSTFAPPSPFVTMASQLWTYSLMVDDPAVKSAARSRIEEALGGNWTERADCGPSCANLDYIDYGFKVGSLERALVWAADANRHVASKQQPDGSWRYTGEGNICPDPLGELGETTLGINATPAASLLRHARITRDPNSLAAGLKALTFMDRFIKPAGAEVGEVPLWHGDLWAATWAIRAYVDGYRITGDAHYLEKAREWAFKGLPFIYLWNAPDRPVMRYASISVFGTSCWTGYWAGIPVQWVGLEYASALLRLAELDSTLPWHRIAEGITIAAIQMQETSRDRPLGRYVQVRLTTTAPTNSWAFDFGFRVNYELGIPGDVEFYVDDASMTRVGTTTNLLPNPGFEEVTPDGVPVGWAWFETGERRVVADANCRSGRCVHVRAGKDQFLGMALEREIPVEPGARYEMSWWVKMVEAVPPASGPVFRIDYFLRPEDVKWVSRFALPLTGLFPDAYDVIDQAGYAPLSPFWILEDLLPLMGANLHVNTTSVSAGDAYFVVNAIARIVYAQFDARRSALRVELQYVPDETSHVLIVTSRRPTAVSKNGAALPELWDLEGAGEGWKYDPENNFLYTKLLHSPAPTDHITVFVESRTYLPVLLKAVRGLR